MTVLFKLMTGLALILVVGDLLFLGVKLFWRWLYEVEIVEKLEDLEFTNNVPERLKREGVMMRHEPLKGAGK